MLRYLRTEDMAAWPIKILRPSTPVGTFPDGTIADVMESLADCHWSLRHAGQQHFAKRARLRVKIARSALQPATRYVPSFAPGNYAGGPLNVQQSFTFSSQNGGFYNGVVAGPAGGNAHWETTSKEDDPATEITTSSGDFHIPDNIFTPATLVVDQDYEFEWVKLNYMMPLDANIVKEATEEDEDPLVPPEIRSLRAQAVANYKGTFSLPDGSLIAVPGETTILPIFRRKFEDGDPQPDFRLSINQDRVGVFIYLPDLPEFNDLVGGSSDVPGAPRWDFSNGFDGSVWQNSVDADYTFVAFHEQDQDASGTKVGYIEQIRNGAGNEALAVTAMGVVYLP